MSTTTTVTTICDITRAHPLADAEALTVRFSLDGRDYEADLCEGCLGLLTSDLESFIAAARPAAPARKPGRPVSRRRYSARVRAWAIAGGLTTQATGTISPRIYARYEAAHRGKS